MRKKGIWLLSAVLCLLLAFSVAAPAFANGPPSAPHPFYGTVTIAGSPAPVGTVITAEVAGVECGSYTTTVEGQYGSADPLEADYLVVQGDIDEGATIDFYVGGVEANEKANFHSGADPTELNLTTEAPPDTTDPEVIIDDIADYVNVLDQISGTASDNVAVDKVRVSIENTTDSVFWNGTDWSSVTEVWLDATGTETWIYAMPELTSGKSYQVRAKAIDTSTNESTVASDSFAFDTTAPTVDSTLPAAGATDVAVDATVSATFDEDVTLVDETGVSITGSVSGDLLTGVSLDEATNTLTIGHSDFASGEDIAVTIASGVVDDLAGNPNAEVSWSFTAAAGITFSWQLKAGWNMVSLPVDPGTTNPDEVFSDVGSYYLYTWDATDKKFVIPTELVLGKAYWILVFEDVTQTIDGTAIDQYSLQGSAGWHMIGSLSVEAQVEVGSGDVFSQFYTWDATDKKYVLSTSLEAGRGYWLLAFTDFSITVVPKEV